MPSQDRVESKVSLLIRHREETVPDTAQEGDDTRKC